MSMCDGRQTQPSRHVNGALRFANERETVVRFQSNTPRAKLLTIEIGVQYSYSAHTNKRVNTEILILSQYVGFIVPRLVRGSTSGASLRQVLRARVSCHSFLVHFPESCVETCSLARWFLQGFAPSTDRARVRMYSCHCCNCTHVCLKHTKLLHHCCCHHHTRHEKHSMWHADRTHAYASSYVYPFLVSVCVRARNPNHGLANLRRARTWI